MKPYRSGAIMAKYSILSEPWRWDSKLLRVYWLVVLYLRWRLRFTALTHCALSLRLISGAEAGYDKLD